MADPLRGTEGLEHGNMRKPAAEKAFGGKYALAALKRDRMRRAADVKRIDMWTVQV